MRTINGKTNLTINFVGNFSQGIVGEISDETHLSREIEDLGHVVRRIPRDEWREAVLTGKEYPNVPEDLGADSNIICKCHHFDDREFVNVLRDASNAPVFYWTWDWMQWPETHEWHLRMSRAADVHLTNELGDFNLMTEKGVKPYYFPFDVADGKFDKPINDYPTKKFDVVFFGSYVGQGDRIDWLRKIDSKFPVRIYAFNHEDWIKNGFKDAHPAVYGDEFVIAVSDSKIMLQFSVNDHIYGYWSNRVGKIMSLGGFLLCRYIPGMELALSDGVDYFSSVDEALFKIKHYLENGYDRSVIARRGYEIGRSRMTSARRVKELMILVERYIRGGMNEK